MTTSTQERFMLLLQGHKKIIYKVAHAYCGSADDRADLEQEIVAQLWRSFGRYDDRYRFSTWMYRVALNVGISFSRGAARRNRPLVPAEDALLEMQPAPPDSREAEKQVHRLYRAISRLGEVDRALILLYLDGQRHHDIAEILGRWRKGSPLVQRIVRVIAGEDLTTARQFLDELERFEQSGTA